MRRGTVYLEMPMSQDGFVAGPNVSTERPMGEGAGASVHDWMFSGWSDAEAERRARPLHVRAPSNSSKDRCERTAVMGKVTSDVSMSLDGFITGPNVRVGNGMGDDGDRLHDWMFDAKTETDAAIVAERYASTGAVLIGKRMFDVGFEPWGDPPPFGMPVFIVTHEQRKPLPMQGGTTYTFVTDGIEAALELARAAAGEKNVGIWGGANIMRQYLKAGLLDEMQIHLIPILLGNGIRLFEDLDPEGIELRRTNSIETPGATHFRFEVVK